MYYSVRFTLSTLLFFYSQQFFYDLGWNKIQISAVMLFAGAASCLGAACSEKLYKKLGGQIVRISMTAVALCMMVYGFRNPFAAVLALLIDGFFNSVLYPIQSISFNRLIPSAQRATMISVNSMAFSIGMALLFPAAGALADCLDLASVLSGLGVLALLGTVFARKIEISNFIL